MEMRIVTSGDGDLVTDEEGRVCLCDYEGSIHFVDPSLLPENFFEDNGTGTEQVIHGMRLPALAPSPQQDRPYPVAVPDASAATGVLIKSEARNHQIRGMRLPVPAPASQQDTPYPVAVPDASAATGVLIKSEARNHQICGMRLPASAPAPQQDTPYPVAVPDASAATGVLIKSEAGNHQIRGMQLPAPAPAPQQDTPYPVAVPDASAATSVLIKSEARYHQIDGMWLPAPAPSPQHDSTYPVAVPDASAATGVLIKSEARNHQIHGMRLPAPANKACTPQKDNPYPVALPDASRIKKVAQKRKWQQHVPSVPEYSHPSGSGTQRVQHGVHEATSATEASILQHDTPYQIDLPSALGSPQEIRNEERQQHTPDEIQTENANLENQQHIPSDETRKKWTRTEILALIELYKENKHLFEANNIKNSEAWRQIAIGLGSHTPKQCESKFKYLKQQYVKKKDNMGTHSSGAQAITFEYFDDFDSIFDAEPNITPVALASSIESGPVLVESPESPAVNGIDENIDPLPESRARRHKQRRTRLEIQIERFEKGMNRRDQARALQMQKFYEIQSRFNEKMIQCIDRLIDKL